MRPLYRRLLPVAAIVIALASTNIRAQKAPELAEVLQSAADYLVQYSQKLGVIAGEEGYAQSNTNSGQSGMPTRLVTDFVLVGRSDGSVSGFRDVVSIGGAAVKQPKDRLATLFTASPASSLQQARQMSDESARYYLSPNLRILDQPTQALEFLRKENQERSTFKIDSVKTVKGAAVAVVKFNERGAPLLINVPGTAAAEGRFWIDVATGAVRQSEIIFVSKSVDISAAVNYAVESKLGLWLPVSMFQRIQISVAGTGASNLGAEGGYGSHQGLEGRADYGKYRQVTADTSKIK